MTAHFDMRQLITLDVTFEASDSNLKVDLANVATDAVMDALGGLTAVDTTDEFLRPAEKGS
jgi:hypothetical protein